MDDRLRAALDASIGWYEDICVMHGIGSELRDGLWRSLEPPPALHSDAVVVEPTITAETVVSALHDRPRCGVKDSFATLDLAGAGFRVLFRATWLCRGAPSPPPPDTPAQWSTVSTSAELDEWNRHHDTAGILLPTLLSRAHFRVLAKRVGGRIVTGAVARLGTGVVHVSNVFSVPGHKVDWTELAEAAGAQFPARPLVGYESSAHLLAARDAGFDPIGDLLIWVR